MTPTIQQLLEYCMTRAGEELCEAEADCQDVVAAADCGAWLTRALAIRIALREYLEDEGA